MHKNIFIAALILATFAAAFVCSAAVSLAGSPQRPGSALAAARSALLSSPVIEADPELGAPVLVDVAKEAPDVKVGLASCENALRDALDDGAPMGALLDRYAELSAYDQMIKTASRRPGRTLWKVPFRAGRTEGEVFVCLDGNGTVSTSINKKTGSR